MTVVHKHDEPPTESRWGRFLHAAIRLHEYVENPACDNSYQSSDGYQCLYCPKTVSGAYLHSGMY